MSQYCFSGATFLCYITVAVTCWGSAIAHLVNQFKSGNRVKSILIGPPQLVFYLLNVGAGLFAFFGSEVLGSTKITETSVSNLSLSIIQASGFALATFFSFRTTVKNGKNIEIGPGLLFAMLLDNVEQRIDHNRIIEATNDITGLPKTPTPRAVLNVVLPHCFDQAEKDTGDRKEKITKALQAIKTNTDRQLTTLERSRLMFNHLHKDFGINVLKSAINLVDKQGIILPDGSTIDSVDNKVSSELKSTGEELDLLLQKLGKLG